MKKGENDETPYRTKIKIYKSYSWCVRIINLSISNPTQLLYMATLRWIAHESARSQSGFWITSCEGQARNKSTTCVTVLEKFSSNQIIKAPPKKLHKEKCFSEQIWPFWTLTNFFYNQIIWASWCHSKSVMDRQARIRRTVIFCALNKTFALISLRLLRQINWRKGTTIEVELAP